MVTRYLLKQSALIALLYVNEVALMWIGVAPGAEKNEVSCPNTAPASAHERKGRSDVRPSCASS
jgi:hypothetical protein